MMTVGRILVAHQTFMFLIGPAFNFAEIHTFSKKIQSVVHFGKTSFKSAGSGLDFCFKFNVHKGTLCMERFWEIQESNSSDVNVGKNVIIL